MNRLLLASQSCVNVVHSQNDDLESDDDNDSEDVIDEDENNVNDRERNNSDLHNSTVDTRSASVDKLREEQIGDSTLKACWNLAKREKGGMCIEYETAHALFILLADFGKGRKGIRPSQAPNVALVARG